MWNDNINFKDIYLERSGDFIKIDTKEVFVG